jgi:hypothetical protein
MSGSRAVALIGQLFILVAVIGLALWLLRFVGLLGFGFGSLPGLIVVAVVGVGLTYLARRM